MVLIAGNTQLTAHIQADGLILDLGQRFSGGAGNSALLRMGIANDALPFSRHNSVLHNFINRQKDTRRQNPQLRS